MDCYQVWIESNANQWVEYSEAEWLACAPGLLNQIWTDDDHVYAAIDFGLEIIDLISESKVAYIPYIDGFETVWADDDNVYLGTPASGIKYLDKTCISGSISTPYDLSDCLMDYSSPYGELSSQSIRYIHGNGNKLICCTASGVDVYWGDFGYKSTATIDDPRKCFMTSTGKFYYTSVSGGFWVLNRVNSCLFDWVVPDYVYVADGNTVLVSGIAINDIFATEDTSVSGSGYNTVFAATSSGVYVIDEGSLDYVIYYKE